MNRRSFCFWFTLALGSPIARLFIECNIVSDDLLNKTLISYNGTWLTFPFMYIWWNYDEVFRFTEKSFWWFLVFEQMEPPIKFTLWKQHKHLRIIVFFFQVTGLFYQKREFLPKRFIKGGHVVRMPDDRLPKAVFYGELTSGKRKRGGQKVHYKDVLKHHLKATDMNVDTWESEAKNWPFWRKKIIDAGNTIERKRKEKYLEGWRKRHPRGPT